VGEALIGAAAFCSVCVTSISSLRFIRLVRGYVVRRDCKEESSSRLRFRPKDVSCLSSVAFVLDLAFFCGNVGWSFLQFEDRSLSSIFGLFHVAWR
jgi:hypothetical protein